MANPTLLTSPIAENGDKNVIPASTGATTGLLDQEHGFQQINELPLQAGGLPPQRKDFNGAFNLLSKILFYVQKGYIFEFDENQDYYAGCITKDTDGGLYCAKTDVSASSTHPKDDATSWIAVYRGINTRDVITTSGTYTASVSGWYKVTLKGAGGGGGGTFSASGWYYAGAGGGEGGTTIVYAQMQAGDTANVVIGAGGTGSAGGSTNGTDGGDTSVTINGTTYTGNGGKGATSAPGQGGNGTIIGAAGSLGLITSSTVISVFGGTGGGEGGGSFPKVGTNGGGGAGTSSQGTAPATAGGNGYVWFEYFI